jgi:glycosyltransferase involved in cell wall biosynthesis
MPSLSNAAPLASVVLCTFNRAGLVADALDALLRQDPDTPPYEVIVVDNNSTDATPSLVERFASSGTVRYLRETRPGVSHARNRGIREARAAIVAFTDDDVRVASNWIKHIVETFADRPHAAFIGGKVLPIWTVPPPAWLRAAGVAPLAIADYGDIAAPLDPRAPRCLLSANLAIRREAFDRIGLFSSSLQRVGDGIGSTEDQEIEQRLLAAGYSGWYEPSLIVHALVPERRLHRNYHRAWHLGHGRFYALMHDPAFERSRTSLLGVPLHVYGAAVRALIAWLRDLILLRGASAFAHELRLRFMLGFARQRILGGRHA